MFCWFFQPVKEIYFVLISEKFNCAQPPPPPTLHRSRICPNTFVHSMVCATLQHRRGSKSAWTKSALKCWRNWHLMSWVECRWPHVTGPRLLTSLSQCSKPQWGNWHCNPVGEKIFFKGLSINYVTREDDRGFLTDLEGILSTDKHYSLTSIKLGQIFVWGS